MGRRARGSCGFGCQTDWGLRALWETRKADGVVSVLALLTRARLFGLDWCARVNVPASALLPERELRPPACRFASTLVSPSEDPCLPVLGEGAPSTSGRRELGPRRYVLGIGWEDVYKSAALLPVALAWDHRHQLVNLPNNSAFLITRALHLLS